MKIKSHDSSILACLGEKATSKQIKLWIDLGLINPQLNQNRKGDERV